MTGTNCLRSLSPVQAHQRGGNFPSRLDTTDGQNLIHTRKLAL